MIFDTCSIGKFRADPSHWPYFRNHRIYRFCCSRPAGNDANQKGDQSPGNGKPPLWLEHIGT